MKKILYFMYIDWGWIKQRPQFLAEGLGKLYEVLVLCGRRFGTTQNLKDSSSADIEVKTSFRLPFIRWNIVFYLNNYLLHKLIYRKAEHEADFIWFTHPSQYAMFYNWEGKKLVYDCMDDILEFQCRENVRKRNAAWEKRLCHDADLIICSSNYLRKKLIQRYCLKRDIFVVNNAISFVSDGNMLLGLDAERLFEGKRKKFVYIGTISDWFDFDLLLESLSINDDFDYILFGPAEVTIPVNERIKYGGILKHEDVLPTILKSDVLIMPFQVTELVKSVNPVKLYEYIYAYKPVLVPDYPEVKQFSDYVYLYSTKNDFFRLILEIVNDTFTLKGTELQYHDFVKQNTWENRVAVINELLKEL